MEINFNHKSVLLNECIDNLAIRPNGVYVDGTLGGAGHSEKILSRLENGLLIAIDKDEDALTFARAKLKEFKNVIFVKDDFKNIKNILKDLNRTGVDGILLDLGVSSYQIDTPDRGFSYRYDAPLDMRMDKDAKLKAFDVVNYYSKENLEKILFEYGEESFAKKIVAKIIQDRTIKPIETTGELAKIIESVVPKKFQIKSNPCKKTFQAIRIEVNGELENLKNAIEDMIGVLNSSGRLAVITFHSLEDRIVKNCFKLHSTDCICDKSIPICVCHHKKDVKLINKNVILPSSEELKENKRSSSAKLRIIEKL